MLDCWVRGERERKRESMDLGNGWDEVGMKDLGLLLPRFKYSETDF